MDKEKLRLWEAAWCPQDYTATKPGSRFSIIDFLTQALYTMYSVSLCSIGQWQLCPGDWVQVEEDFNASQWVKRSCWKTPCLRKVNLTVVLRLWDWEVDVQPKRLADGCVGIVRQLGGQFLKWLYYALDLSIRWLPSGT